MGICIFDCVYNYVIRYLMIDRTYQKLEVSTTPFNWCRLNDKKTPWDEDGIVTFANQYNRFYLDDKVPSVSPHLGAWRTTAPQMKDVGALYALERGILVSEKLLKILKDFHLAPHVLFEVPYEIKYDINTQWNESGNYYVIFFYTSLFNDIVWSRSVFYQHVYTEPDIVIADDIQFESSNHFQKNYKINLMEEGLDISPRKLYFQDNTPQYDIFGVFYYERSFHISNSCADLLNKHKIFTKYTKPSSHNYKMEWS